MYARNVQCIRMVGFPQIHPTDKLISLANFPRLFCKIILDCLVYASEGNLRYIVLFFFALVLYRLLPESTIFECF